ncbi:Hypothetical protein probably associated with Carbamoyl-phosphate synthase [hydrothermal vent metagenome]|uniref:Uncharacterized protein n=1 Tax=hydrothermal vent metagenome TaxID=652676 RepID=A0A1W1C306_9ZZZZ
MKLTLKAVPHIANKVAIELGKSGVVTFTQGMDPVVAAVEKILIENIKQEMALEEKANEICSEHQEDIEFMLADERQLFFMIKKRLAPEFGVILDYEERFSDLSHKILDELYEEDLINYDVAENMIKNIIFNAITSFVAEDSELHYAVVDKIKSYKRKYIPGTDEYEILYEKLYKEELVKRGLD